MPDITLYYLQCSRSIRIAWLLEELNLPYTLKSYNREPNGDAPAAFVTECGARMGKAPVLKDGNLVIEESGAITQCVSTLSLSHFHSTFLKILNTSNIKFDTPAFKALLQHFTHFD